MDDRMGPKEAWSTVLSPEEEAIGVAFRRHTLLPLDDCLHALQPTLPHLTPSSLHRCFVIPAEAHDVRLILETSVPAHVVPGSSDDRHLGVALAALTIDDGLTGAREVDLDDARLGKSFYAVSSGARWTDGSAVLPADLWANCKGSFFLRVTLAGPALPRCIAPGDTAGVVNLADCRQA